MKHRHLISREWSLEAIDSALERGDLEDWRALFAAARKDISIARGILRVSLRHDLGGTSVLAQQLVVEMWPGLRPETE